METVGCSIVCQDRQGHLSSSWFIVDCSSAQCAQTYWHSVAQVYIIHTHGFGAFFCLFTHHYSWIETPRVISYDHIRIINARLAFPKTLHNFSHFLILLKSGNQYRSKCMKNICCCCVHVHFSAWKIKRSVIKTLGNIKNYVMLWDNLSCIWVYDFLFFLVHGKIVFPELCLNIVFLSICNSHEFQFFPPDFLWL